MRIGLGQMLVEGGQPRANLDRAVAQIARAADAGCQLVVLPECLDLGWTDPSARHLAQPIPGPHVDQLAGAAKAHGTHVVAGLVERVGERRYNAAVLIDPAGELRLLHRKINELDIAHDLYATGDRLGVAETALGTIGITICADNFANSLAIGHTLARMGAQLIVAPSAWAVEAGHDNAREPYGAMWREAFARLSRLYDLTVVAVSGVGWLASGPWAGRKQIGCSLVVGPGGRVLAEGPYGETAEALITVDVDLLPPIGRGTQIARALRQRGYDGP